MPESENQTTLVQGWINRLRAGDPWARDALLACAIDRLDASPAKCSRASPASTAGSRPTTSSRTRSSGSPGAGGRHPPLVP